MSILYEDKNAYSEIIKLTTEYVNSSSYETILHSATYHLCNVIVLHIKQQLKEYTINNLKKNHTAEQISKLSENVLNEHFNTLLLEKNKYNENILDVYNYRKHTKDEMINKYNQIYQKNETFALRQKNSTELIEHAKLMLKYSIDSLNSKLTSFHNDIFNETKYQHRVVLRIDYNSIFNNKLKNILKSENKLGVPCDIDLLQDLINFITTNFNDSKEEKINQILSQLPKNIMNADKVKDMFNEKNMIDFLWLYIINSVTIQNPLSSCPLILYEFMNEEKIGIREAYIGEFLKRIQDITDFLSKDEKSNIIKLLLDSNLDIFVKEQFI